MLVSRRTENTKPNDLLFFPKDYTESRESFRSAARLVREKCPAARVGTFRVPSAVDEDLTVDSLYVPAREPNLLLVLVSGIHGMETYTGAAIQRLFLEEFGAAMLDKGVGLLIVHAMNPFGFKYHRRVTESNVNLNRNFSATGEIFSMRNSGYEKLAPLLEPSTPVRNPTASFLNTAWFMTSRLLLGKYTVNDFIEAVGQGQFHSAKGIEYGGRGLEPQTGHLIGALKEAMPAYKDILLLDLHTGLGHRYQIHLMPGDRPESVDRDLFERLFRADQDRDIYEYTTGDAEGFYHTHGDLNDVFPDLAATGQRVVAVTVEFGTLGNGALPKLQTINRLITENQGHHHGYASAAVEAQVKNDFAELFFPSEAAWRRNAISRARRLFERLLNRI